MIKRFELIFNLFDLIYNVGLYDEDNEPFNVAKDFFFRHQNLKTHNLDLYKSLTFGEKVYYAFTSNNISIPQEVDYAAVVTKKRFAETTNLEKYLTQILGKNNIVNIEDDDYDFIMDMEKISPHKLVSAISIAVKQNSAALGKDAILFGYKYIEKTPAIKPHLESLQQIII